MHGKKVLFFMALFGLFLFGCQQEKDQRVIVQGVVSQLGESKLYVTYTDAQYKRSFDTIHSSKNGEFSLKLQTCEELSPITIYFAEKKCWTTLFAEPGNHINIRGNILSVDLLSIRGGHVNNDLNRFKMQIKELYQERLDLLKGSYPNENSSEVRLAEINLLLKRSAKEFIIENPSSIASVVLIQDFFYQDYDPATRDLLGLLKGDASISRLAYRIREGVKKWN